MSKPVVPPSPPPWHWPVDVTHYDRSPDLNEVEQAELKRLMGESSFQLRPSTKERLHRLLLPLQDVFTLTHLSPDICHETVRVMVVEMSRRGKTFWAWSEAEWMDIIGSSYTSFAQRYGRSSPQSSQAAPS